jgi:hypothetical protein
MTALKSRSVIDQAIGIICSRNGCSADEAFQRLRRISNTDRVKLAGAAHQVVDRSARRVRARRPSADRAVAQPSEPGRRGQPTVRIDPFRDPHCK